MKEVMKNTLRNLSALSAFMLLFVVTQAQESCTDVLKRANTVYEDGNVENVEQILQRCLKEGFTKEEKLDAYRLIILSKIYDEKIEEAESYMLKFLEVDPEYELNPAKDPEEFEVLYGDFQTSPLWSWGIFGGINFLYPNQLEEFGTYHTENQDYDEFKTSGVSFHFGAKYNRFIAPRFELNLNAIYESDEFTYSTLGLNEYDSISQVESQTNISIPLSVTYDLLDDVTYKPYARLGLNTSYLINASADLSRSYIVESQNNDEDLTYNELAEVRKRLQFAVLAGLGVKWKIPKGYVFLESWYRYGLNNQVIPEDRLIDGNGNENADRYLRIRHIDSDFSLDKLSFSIGYVRNVYNPRKKEVKK